VLPHRRILLIRLSHLGDVVHALPVFHALRAAHPSAEIAWAVQPEFAGLLEGLPGLARIFRFERRKGVAAWIPFLSGIRGWDPDWAVDAQGNAKSAMATIGSGAKRRTGLHPQDWREPFAARVLTEHAAPTRGEVPHAMDRMLSLARFVAPDRELLRADPALSESELEAGRARLASLLGDRDGPVVILHLSAPPDVRAWPVGHFETLARALDEGGDRVLVLSGPQEEEEGRALARQMSGVPRVRHAVGQRGLRELAALFAAARDRGGRILCCDTGPMHLAAALALPVVCLAGPQDARRTGPWPLPGGPDALHAVLRAPDPPACAPCLARRCTHPEGAVCMSRIRPEAALRTLLQEAGASRRGREPSSYRTELLR